MPFLLFEDTNITADMAALNNEDPNPPGAPVDGAFGLVGIKVGELITANVIPRTGGVTGYTIEFGFYPTQRDGLPPASEMWMYSSDDREVVSLPGGGSPAEAQRLGGRFFQIEKPAGYDWGYVRISDVLGGGVDLQVWRDG